MRRNEWGIYDSPLWRDWLVYLTLLGVAGGISQPEGRDTPIDLVVMLIIQTIVFGGIPGILRVWVRAHRH